MLPENKTRSYRVLKAFDYADTNPETHAWRREVGTVLELTQEMAEELGTKVELVAGEDPVPSTTPAVLKKYKVVAEDGIDWNDGHLDAGAEFEADPGSEEFAVLAKGEVEVVEI